MVDFFFNMMSDLPSAVTSWHLDMSIGWYLISEPEDLWSHLLQWKKKTSSRNNVYPFSYSHESKSMIAPVTDGEVLTNYQVLPLSCCPWRFLRITVLDGCQKELRHFSNSQNSVQRECWKCWNSVDVIACEKAPGPNECSKKWLQWYWKGLDNNRPCSLPLTMWGRSMLSTWVFFLGLIMFDSASHWWLPPEWICMVCSPVPWLIALLDHFLYLLFLCRPF